MHAPRVNRRDLLLGLAALAAAAGARGQPRPHAAPPGSTRCLVEVILFRQPGPPPAAVPAGPLPQIGTIAGRVEKLPDTEWQLGMLEAGLRRRSGFQVLAHTAWAAIVPPNGRTTAQLEELLPAGTGLAGMVSLQRSQYLFLGVDVDFVAPEGPTYGLRERRRIKFNERHYFDSPALGVIAEVRPGRGAAAID
jgi:hypothetical protein